MINHNHITREVKLSNGICPACDFSKFREILKTQNLWSDEPLEVEYSEESFIQCVWPMLKDSREEFERMENAWRENMDYGRPPGQ